MQTKPTSEPTGSPVPGVERDPPHGVLARLLRSLRGDQYMVDAYPPAWQGAAPVRDSVPPTPEG